ncbi:MAG: polysaccharide biosynthesis/export family protein [Desulfobacteraceae bacterium]|nr:polysaccharide biosynthesis/export family protein [Pseudomonadota bacterium]MCG2753985.1 polysaccharide biosynthesis/export family protein [Desulfobacteraceae bacterium]
MNCRMRNLSIAVIAGLFILSLSACTFEARGIPVKEFQRPEALAKIDAAKQKKMEEAVAMMSRVAENSVFTERRGIPEYKIGPGDVLIITFWDGAKSVPYNTVVRPDGKISYSYMDDITVAGRTCYEVDEILTKALKEYIRNPRIDVVVNEYRSKTALLFGQINRLDTSISGIGTGPGKYPLMGKTKILDLIVMAGGPIVGEEFANADLRSVEVVRRGKIYTVNLYNTMFKGDMSQNIVIDDGDIVTVPELPTYGERVYVFGEVNTQGIYRLKDAYDLLAAVSKAGGTTRVAVDSDIKIIRGYEKDREKPIILAANLDEILKKGDMAQNIALLDGDVIYVPRTAIGDLNEFIVNSTPLLDYLFYPDKYRNAYFNPETMLRFRKLH